MQNDKLACFAVLTSVGLFAAGGMADQNAGRGGHTGSIGKLPIERDINPELPTVVFYVLPRCGICANIDRWLVKLDKDNPGVANYVRKNSTDKTIHPEMNARRVKHHGLVFLDTKTNVTWTAQAHGLRKEVFTAAFSKHLVPRNPAATGKVPIPKSLPKK